MKKEGFHTDCSNACWVGKRHSNSEGKLFVRPEVAQKQSDLAWVDQESREKRDEEGIGQVKEPGLQRPPTTLLTRFHGSVTLDPTRVGRDAGRVAEEVIQHLAGLVGSRLEITLEVEAEIPEGVPNHAVRTVTENCRSLRFKAHGFERD